MAGAELCPDHLDPTALIIEVIPGEQAITAELGSSEHMAVAGKTAAVETSKGRGLVGEGDGIRQQGIGLVPDQERALPHHGICVVEPSSMRVTGLW